MATTGATQVRSQETSASTTRSGGVKPVNVGTSERIGSALVGGLLAAYGLERSSLSGMALMLAGGALVYRGVTGRCSVYQALGINTSEEHSAAVSVPAQQGVKVEQSIVIHRSPEELYAFWRNLENLPRVMRHLESVTVKGDRSHWVTQGPLGSQVEWDAEIINERENELIAWRSVEGSQVDTAGSVRFEPALGGGATQLTVSLKYNPPAGRVGIAAARLFGQDAQQQIEEDLRRLKETLEVGSGAAGI